jgi:short-subunit dehydrogenase involved in D-alanine esterification of teichoic acids
MKSTGNTILVTGGGSGIGRAYAEAFLKLGNRVIIAGRRKQVLDEVVVANPGMESTVLDVEDGASIKPSAEALVKRFPKLPPTAARRPDEPLHGKAREIGRERVAWKHPAAKQEFQ